MTDSSSNAITDAANDAPNRPLLCSRPPDRRGEPLAGTGPKVPTVGWLAVEHDGEWNSHSVADGAGLPDGLHAWITEHTARLGAAIAERSGRTAPVLARALLIRRPEAVDRAGQADRAGAGGRGPLHVHLAWVGRGRWTLRAADLDALLSTDPIPLLDRPPTDDPHPLVLVCGHLERDRCCAAGHPLARALHAADAGDVWLCSHLGGHRYAPTLLTLPEGALYGRVDPADVPELAHHLGEGRLWAERLRGRVDLAPAAQAADAALRLHLGRNGVGALPASALELVEADDGPEHGQTPEAPEPGQTLAVRLRHAGRIHRVELRVELGPEEVLASCGPPERLVGLPGQQWTAEKSVDLPRTRPLRFVASTPDGTLEGARVDEVGA